MDLFGDLPPPSRPTDSGELLILDIKFENGTNILNKAHHTCSTTAPSLFDDLPPESDSTKNDNNTSLGKHKSHDSEGETGSGEAKKLKMSAGHYKLKAYIGERRGEREDMQDAHIITDDFTPQFPALPNDMYVSIIICSIIRYL